MVRFFANARYDFIGVRRTAYIATAVVLGIGLIALVIRGVNYSVEFTGGTLVQISTTAPVDVGAVRAGLAKQGIHGAELQSFGSQLEYVIRARTAKEGSDADNTQETAAAIAAGLDVVLGTGTYVIDRTEAVGPKVGGELRQKALIAIFLSFFAVLLYLAFRFEWRFGLAAVVATAHDLATTIGFIAFMDLEVSLVVVAAILSMVGYSLNDTIIIFDRVRENLHKLKGKTLTEVLNQSINETLPRSILTHGTTLVTLGALAIFAGEVIRPFALVMFFSVFTATFSSIFIAAPVLLLIEDRWPGAAVKMLRAPVKGAGARKAQPVR
ncbi:MAG: protein translocase subunit SecF [Gemmatimonadota bacterium]